MRSTLILAAIAAVGSCHVHMASPGALRSGDNPLAKAAGIIDSSYNSPLLGDGKNFPCKGYHTDVAEGKPGSGSVADWAPGSSQKVTFGTGGAGHGGGSCQISLSVDQGQSFKVIKSFMGGCPAIRDGNGQGSLIPELAFTVPNDAPAGSALLAWTWVNYMGNREFYMNCAHVTITEGGSGSESVPFDQRPEMFKANLGDGSCKTAELIDIEYPEPGPDAVIAPGAKLGAPNCGDGGGAGGSTPGSAPAVPSRGLEARPSGSSSTTTINSPATPSSGSPGSALIPDPSDLGRCGLVDGVSYTCVGGRHGASCSSFGYCGDTAEHSGPGCQPQFGTCSGSASTTKSLALESSTATVRTSTSSFLGVQPSSLPSSFSSEATGVSNSTTSSTAASTTSPLPVVPTSSTAPLANLPVHPEGKCGVLRDDSKFTCNGSGRGCACSGAGWCGVSPAHYGEGCQSAFGTCGEEAASCKVTIQSGTPGNSTTATTSQPAGKVPTTTILTTTTPVSTVTVTATVVLDSANGTTPLTSTTASADSTTSSPEAGSSTEAPSYTSNTFTTVAPSVPTTLITETRPGTSSEGKSDPTSVGAGGPGTIVARYRRPAGSFLDFLDRPKVVSGTITKASAKATGGALFSTRL